MTVNPIVAENDLTGSSGWNFSNRSNTAIQSYTDKVSYNPSDTVTFYSSTPSAGTGYQISIYRLGSYGGNGGRLITTISGLTGLAQGYWDGATLNSGSATPYIDGTTHLTEANWTSTATWSIPANAVAGVYLAMFTTTTTGQQNVCTFVVKGNSSADYLVIRPCCTDAAYNAWGGWSLYTSPTVGVKVSFLRPQYGNSGGGGVLAYEAQALHWLELQRYNLDYTTDVDVYAGNTTLTNYKAILIIGHNEYWTKTYRDNMEAAIAAGVGVAFLGANASYWQCRLEASHTGSVANQTVVCYKVTTGAANLANDPQYGVTNNIVTSQWRDAVLNRKENSMIGIMYSSFNNGGNVAWTTDPSMDTTYNTGTGITANTSYGSDLVGYEWDKIQSGSPAGLKTIATTATTKDGSDGGGSDTSNTTFYVASSGALVFASGSVGWTWALDTYRYNAANVAVISAIQALTANILYGLIQNKATKAFAPLGVHA